MSMGSETDVRKGTDEGVEVGGVLGAQNRCLTLFQMDRPENGTRTLEIARDRWQG